MIWGTDTYTDDSSVCTAAVHSGAISLAAGGTVTIEIRPGLDAYRSSTRNGITSVPYGSWHGSFVFVTGPQGSATPTPAPTSGNLLLNGSFEDGPNPGGIGIATLQPNSTAIEHWTVTLASIDYVGGYWKAAAGQRSLDLDGTPGFGGIQQTFTTVPDRVYHVSFYLAGNPDGPPTVKVLGVRAAGAEANFTVSNSGKSKSAMGWTEYLWSFRATSTSTTLEFLSRDTVSGYHGPVLDNVSVSQV